MASAFTVPCETLGGEPQSVSLHTVVVVFVQARKTRLPCNASQIEQAAQAHVALDSWLANVFWGHVRHRVFVPARHEPLTGISLLLALHPEQALPPLLGFVVLGRLVPVGRLVLGRLVPVDGFLLVHTVAPALAYVPGLQAAHCLALVTLLARPAGHPAQAVLPAPANLPAPHATHGVRESLSVSA